MKQREQRSPRRTLKRRTSTIKEFGERFKRETRKTLSQKPTKTESVVYNTRKIKEFFAEKFTKSSLLEEHQVRSFTRITIKKENFSSLIIICISVSNSLIPAYHNNALHNPYAVKLASNIHFVYYLFMPCIHDFMSDIILINSTLYTCNAVVCIRLNFQKGTLSHKIILIKCLHVYLQSLTMQFNSIQKDRVVL